MSTGTIKQRNAFWQCVRGLCILAVVMIHCPSGIEYGAGTFPYTVTLILRQFINFPVAVFFFLAGYFSNPERINNNPRTCVLARGGYLLIPFCIWSTFYTVVSVTQSFVVGESINWLKIIYRFVIGKASAPFYYIVVLVQLTLLTPILIKVAKEKGGASKLLWFVTPAYLVYIYSFNIITGETPRLYETLFPAWFLFYYLGLWIKINGCEGIRSFGKLRFVVAGLALSLIEAVVLITIGCGASFATSQIKASSFVYAGFLILWLIEKERTFPKEKTSKLLHYIGDRSYGIFFIHCFVLMFVRKFSSLLFEDIWILNFIICFIMTALLSVLAVDIVNVLAGKLKIETALKWIGFERSI